MPLVTISGGIGSGVEGVGRLVADEARLELYDDQRLHQEATRMGIRSKDIEDIDEKAPGFFDSLLHNSELYLDLLESVVYQVARTGQGIIIGHGSQVLLREFGCALHVSIHASDAYRVRRIMDQHGLSEKAAEKIMHKADNERRGFLKFAFHMDWNDHSLYDLVLNTEKLGADGAVKLIVRALQLQAIEECSANALDAMERLSLTKRVQAALLKGQFGLYTIFHVEVPEKGVVEITGFASSVENKRQILDAVKKVPGVSRVHDEVSILRASAL